MGNPFERKIDSFYYYDPNDPFVLKPFCDFITFDPTYRQIKFKALKDNIGINTVVTKIYEKVELEEIIVDENLQS